MILTGLAPIEDVVIDLIDVDGISREFTLEAPNARGEDIFIFGFEPIEFYENYRDDNLFLQDGERYFRFVCGLGYESHEMDTRPLLAADTINIKIPPAFGDTDNYQTFEVMFGNQRSNRSFFSGLAGGGPEVTIPNGAETLSFTGTIAYKWNEMLNVARWNQSFNPCDLVINDVLIEELSTPHSLMFGADRALNLGVLNTDFWQGLDAFTIEFWFKTTQTDRARMFNAGYGGGDSWGIQLRLNTKSTYGQAPGNILAEIRDEDTDFYVPYYNSNAGYTDGAWHHMAVKGNYAAPNFRTYIDGNLRYTGALTGGTIDAIVGGNAGIFSFFGNWDGSAVNRPFDGLAFNPRIWRTERTDQELNDSMNMILEPNNHPDLFAQFNFYEGQGSTIADSAGNADAELIHVGSSDFSDFWKTDTPF